MRDRSGVKEVFLAVIVFASLIVPVVSFLIPSASAPGTAVTLRLCAYTLTDDYGATLTNFEALGMPGSTIYYKAYILNTGTTVDNYSVTLTDDQGWAAGFPAVAPWSNSPDDFTNVGNYTIALLKIKIPASAPIGTVDNVHIHVNADNVASADNNLVVTVTPGALLPSFQDTFIRSDQPNTAQDTVKPESEYVGTYIGAVERGYYEFHLEGMPYTDYNENNPVYLAVLEYSAYPGSGDEGTYDAYLVDNHTWREENVTWNNNPGFDNTAFIDSRKVDNLPYGTGVLNSFLGWNVTSAVENIIHDPLGDNILSIMLKSGDETAAVSISLRTKQDSIGSDLWPRLVFGSYFVNAGISPGSQSGGSGSILNYTVTVANINNKPENFNLMVSDNDNWGPTVSPTSLAVAPLSYGTATISVTVPDLLATTIDNITVTATSQDNTAVTASASCTAEATIVPIVRSVSVSISPSSQGGTENAKLNYAVTVTNTGNVSDNYSLTDNDNSGWSLSLSSTSLLNVPPGTSGSATLNVTIPSGADNGAIDSVTVTATSQTDNTVGGAVSCTAQAIISTGYPEWCTLSVGWQITNFRIDVPPWIYLSDYAIFSYTPGRGFYLVPPAPPERENTGYFINAADDISVLTIYTGPVPYNIYLKAGWNLVGFPVTNESSTPKKIFGSQPYLSTYVIFWYKVGAGYLLQGELAPLKDNMGYWVWVNHDMTVTGP